MGDESTSALVAGMHGLWVREVKVTRDPAKPKIVRPVYIMPMMRFTLRFNESFRIMDRKAMTEKTTNKKITVQKLKTAAKDSFAVAERYYTLLSALNNLSLTQREIQLIAFTAVKGNISYANVREEFCSKYDTSNPTINNMISKLKKMGILVKDGSKVKVNPVIVLDFEKEVLMLQITLKHG